MKIWVKAKKKGFSGCRKYPGNRFSVDESKFSPSWMVKIDAPADAEQAEAPDAPVDPEAVGEAQSPLMSMIRVLLDVADHDNDDLWTDQGLIRLGYVKDGIGDKAVTREQVERAKPGFKRKTSK